MILKQEPSAPDAWQRCRQRARWPTYDHERCGELVNFACDRCGAHVCTLHVHVTAMPEALELCSDCHLRSQAQAVVRDLLAQSARARPPARGWPLLAWLRWLFGRRDSSRP